MRVRVRKPVFAIAPVKLPHGSTNITSKITILYNISTLCVSNIPLASVAALHAPPLGALKATHFSCPSIAMGMSCILAVGDD